MELNIQPFKEPRGFIRLLQWLFAICAFATTVDYSGEFGFNIACNSNPNLTTKATGKAEYPFNMDHNSFEIEKPEVLKDCIKPDISLIGNAQSESVFFVFTGVISFLYTSVMVAVYLLADKIYMENRRIPLADFFITIVLAVFWIAGASAWAHGVSNVSTVMDIREWLKCPAGYVCLGHFYSSKSKIVISVLFGFINFVLWAGNIWFLYKETSGILNGVGGPSNPTSGP